MRGAGLATGELPGFCSSKASHLSPVSASYVPEAWWLSQVGHQAPGGRLLVRSDLTPQDPEHGGVTVGKMASRGLHFPSCPICCLPYPYPVSWNLTGQGPSLTVLSSHLSKACQGKRERTEGWEPGLWGAGGVFTECVSLCSVTILMFNSSQRSLVLVKQFRPGETSWVDRNWGWGIVSVLSGP